MTKLREAIYWMTKLREAQAELDVATTRTQVNEAARKFQQAKAALNRLEIESAERPKPPYRGSRSPGASS
jgi:hypothetical protein